MEKEQSQSFLGCNLFSLHLTHNHLSHIFILKEYNQVFLHYNNTRLHKQTLCKYTLYLFQLPDTHLGIQQHINL